MLGEGRRNVEGRCCRIEKGGWGGCIWFTWVEACDRCILLILSPMHPFTAIFSAGEKLSSGVGPFRTVSGRVRWSDLIVEGYPIGSATIREGSNDDVGKGVGW